MFEDKIALCDILEINHIILFLNDNIKINIQKISYKYFNKLLFFIKI